VAVELGRDLGVTAAEDALDSGQVRPAHDEQTRRRVAWIVEPDRPDLDRRPLDIAVYQATSRLSVGGQG